MERLPYLDYARVFVAYLVIFGHLLAMDNHTPRDFIYAFHMPFFFLVSGMLHKFNGQIQWQKYLRTIGVPILFFNAIYFFIINPIYLKLGVYGEGGDITYIDCLQNGLLQLKSFVLENGNIPSGVTWFLIVLLYVKLLMDAFKIHPILTGALYITAFVLLIGMKVKFCYITNALMVFPFYWIGAKFKPYIEKIVFKHGSILYAFLFFILLIGFVWYNGRTSTRGVVFGNAPVPANILLFYASGLIGSIMVLFISAKFKSNKHITYIATSLITILGMQAIFNDPFRTFCSTEHYGLMAIIAIIILLLCTGIHWLIMKYCPMFLGKIKSNK